MTDIIETIYADCFSTTPIDNRVVERMHQLYSTTIGNPSSSSHEYGRAANRVVQSSRETVANMINCSKNEIIFTSGATEGNNLVLVGTAKQLAKTSERRTILYSAIEHPAVIEPLQKLRSEGFDVIKIKCKSTGLVDIDDLTEKLDQNVLMVSIMLVNNELGTIQPIQQLSKLVHEAGALIHTDAAQAIGKIPVDVKVLDVDILTGSSHKMYGPTGVGFVFLRGGSNSFPIAPLFHGGGQENEIRPGTLNAIGIAGFAEACNIAMNEMVKERNRLERIRDNIEEKLLTSIPRIIVNCKDSPRIPGGSSITLPEVDADALIANLEVVALSSGSACKSGAPSPSHVLEEIGLSREQAYNTVRICLGRFNREDDINAIVSDISNAYNTVKNLD